MSKQALELTHVHDVTIDTVLEKLDAKEEVSKEELAKLESLTQATEEPYLEALDKDEEISPDLEALFRRARAIEALADSCGADAQEAAGDAMYNALHAGVTEETVKAYLSNL